MNSKLPEQSRAFEAGLTVGTAVLALLQCAHAKEQLKVLLALPKLTEAPTIDGAVTARNWSGASILSPLVEQPGALVRSQHARIYAGWREANLHFAFHYRPRAAAPGSSARWRLRPGATRLRKLQATDVQLVARLLDSAEANVLSRDTEHARRPGSAQLFLGTANLPAGVYVVEVGAPQDGKPRATQKQRITKPEIPRWWKPRDVRVD